MLKKPKKDAYSEVVPVRMKPEELEEIRKLAEKYTGGNVSWWLRQAAVHYRPLKKDLQK